MELAALPGLKESTLRKYRTENDSRENKTNQEPEYSLRTGVVKVVDGQNHGGRLKAI